MSPDAGSRRPDGGTSLIGQPGGGQPVSRREALRRLSLLCGTPLLAAPARRTVASQDACDALEGRRIRWLVGYSPGGGYDAYSRLIEPFLEEELGAEVFIDNVTGAGGIVAARTLANAPPDGRTLGLVDGPGLLMASRRRFANAPDLGTELLPLGRVSRLQPILVAGANTGLRTIDDVIARARSNPIVFGLTGPVSQNFVNCTVTADLLGLDAEFVTGYPGSSESALAIQRGDVDMASYDTGSALSSIRGGRLVPILQISRRPSRLAPELDGVPHLAGDDGLAARRPELFPPGGHTGAGDPPARAEQLVTFTSLGRLAVAPAGGPGALRTCLAVAVWAALQNPDLHASARRADRPLDVGSAAEVREELARASAALTELLPVVERAARRAR